MFRALALRHRLAGCGPLHIARDPIGVRLLADVLEQHAAVRTNQEKFEYVVDSSISFALANQPESGHHVIDLLRRPGQKQPSGNVGALFIREREKLLGLIVFRVYCYRHYTGIRPERGSQLASDSVHTRGQKQTRPRTSRVDEIEEYRLAFQR